MVRFVRAKVEALKIDSREEKKKKKKSYQGPPLAPTNGRKAEGITGSSHAQFPIPYASAFVFPLHWGGGGMDSQRHRPGPGSMYVRCMCVCDVCMYVCLFRSCALPLNFFEFEVLQRPQLLTYLAAFSPPGASFFVVPLVQGEA